ncbi:hypothetical protein Cpap_1236 [Ruminiclostridium papyrosolvens DSM 2782]|uniref:Uncharacterized protein n=1 Tax=Ruminiclostridium papyrosolvens DSM 2782 TaxID=588581 RepID=F1TFA2_9FIRM|nr:hypothetical protein [Ruminiclostridium papyrosolvens]EGD47040.1 hypothetical protein Cpap_1236 [Ruminiclostridium papyrosolvens DSM 2782]WES33711.1 hypothetical protein P0092_18380 [Ruminiclostridium papyrosolvens DSM 2782]
MDNLLRKIESEEVILYTDQVYSVEVLNKCREIHKSLVNSGKLEGIFEADKWIGNSDVKKYGLDFSLHSEAYKKHIGKEFGIAEETMKNMLRCYAIYCNGVYVYQTIARDKISTIKEFLQKYKDKDFRLTTTGITTLEDFLGFINTPDSQIERITSNIKLIKSKESSQRLLSPIINYLVIENEVNSIYRNNPDDNTFKKWFPIFFWVNITFILPLRATEMLLTPKECIYKENGKTYLIIRRTRLKKGTRTVYYDINKDYKEFTFEIPATEVVRNVEKYIELTKEQDRRFLFEYNELMINNMLSLQSFNHLVAAFVEEHIIGNSRYDFAKYATGITEFEPVTAGDSRPIAMANLYFQKLGEDICRQLADHININTSSGYYTNISETIWASSVVQLQKKLDYEWRYSKEQYEQVNKTAVDTSNSVCTSSKRLADENDLSDCIEQRHLADCMGCEYYRPSKAELESFMQFQQKKADDSARRVIEFMNNTMSIKNKDVSLEEVFLSVQTDATRFRMGCNIKAEEKYNEWQRLRNTQKTSC